MSGAQFAMPFLIVNLGGEMMYILDQRLDAQNIAADKGAKVREDIVRSMLAPEYLEPLMQPQPIYLMSATRQYFDRLAHCSIMKLHSSSMNKLFDLMLMGVKLQLLSITTPTELLDVTINHLTSMQKMVLGTPTEALVGGVITQFQNSFSGMNPWGFYRIRSSILTLLQDKHVKVSLFLTKNLQSKAGNFYLPNNCGAIRAGVPGTVLRFNHNGEPANEVALRVALTESFIPHPGVATQQGLNLYTPSAASVPEEAKDSSPEQQRFRTIFQSKRGEVARWELNELSEMINPGEEIEPFHIDLFEEEAPAEDVPQQEVVAKARNEAVEKFKQELDTVAPEQKQKTEDDELLDLL